MSDNVNAYKSVLQLIGETPLIQLDKVVKGYPGKYYAKFEAFNPGHSNKDRIALHIIEAAEAKGLLKKGSTIIETTSGNTGFSLAMVAAIKGYECILAVTSKSSKDKINMLQSIGAKIHVCPANVPADDPRSYYQVAKRLHQELNGSLYINQYFNDLNTEAHYKSTGPEIWEQTKGQITHLVAPSGTGGTISGCARFLKEQNPEIKVIGVDAYGSVLKKYHETQELDPNEIYPYRIEGLGKNLIPTATQFEFIDQYEKVTDEESAHTARTITKMEGMFVGYTSGAAMQAVHQLVPQNIFDKNSKVVVMFPDHGSRYMSKIYSDEWMNEQGFFDNDHEQLQSVEYINDKRAQ